MTDGHQYAAFHCSTIGYNQSCMTPKSLQKITNTSNELFRDITMRGICCTVGAFPRNSRANYEAQLWGKVKFHLRGTLITQETKRGSAQKQYAARETVSYEQYSFFESQRQAAFIAYSGFESCFEQGGSAYSAKMNKEAFWYPLAQL